MGRGVFVKGEGWGEGCLLRGRGGRGPGMFAKGEGWGEGCLLRWGRGGGGARDVC